MKVPYNYVSSILRAFKSMDIDYLKNNLNEAYSYQSAPKSVFLDEIESIFSSHYTSGDTELLILSGACASEFYNNCCKKGYRFIGNVSRNYFDLVFEIDGDDIKDIFNCAEFKTEEDSGKLGVCAYIDINNDDLITFEKNTEYWNRLNRALDAFDELICDPPRVVSLEDCSYWIQKHSFLNKSIGGEEIFAPQMKWSKFINLYREIKDWCDFIHTDLNLIRDANATYKNNFSEDELIAWIIQYEALFERVPGCLQNSIKKKGEYYATALPTPLFVNGEEFEVVAKFASTFFVNHCDLMEKYRIHSIKETNDVYSKLGFHNEVKNLSSLKYHLKARGNMKVLGIDLSLFPDQVE